MPLKKAPMLQPTASLVPYPIIIPPKRAIINCFLLFIFFHLNWEANNVATKDPKITPIFKIVY